MKMAACGQRILIIGATSAMAQHCARIWAERGAAEFILAARDASRVESITADLKVRAPEAKCRLLEGDFLDPAGVQSVVEEAWRIGHIDIALIAHGSLPEQAECQTDLHACAHTLKLNGVSTALFAEAIAGRMARTGSGRLGVIGSVAGDRGRRSNYVYGAAKGLVTRYVQGLQHRLAGSGVSITLIKPGPTDTPMTYELRKQGAKLASVQEVALAIVDGMDKAKPVVYTPRRWAVIMMVVRHMPDFIFNKLDI